MCVHHVKLENYGLDNMVCVEIEIEIEKEIEIEIEIDYQQL